MAAQHPITTELRAGFLSSVKPKKVFHVPRNVFPIAIDPPYVSADKADFMRNSDWVVGVRVGEEARCYPAWVMDNYHAVNDTLGGQHLAVMHCEICCSNAVYLPDLPDGRLTFGTAGLYGGTLAVYDTQTESLWSHGMGVAFNGELKGTVLPVLQSFQATWEEWLSFYPDTTVMAWNHPAIHPDGRHGHGARDTFAHAGMYVEPVSTMIVGNDNRLPENEMVLTLYAGNAPAALPLRELARAGGLLQSDTGGLKLVTISAGQASALCGIFHRHHPGDSSTDLDFELIDGVVIDKQTGSSWRADGLSTAGELKGQRLEPVPAMINKWHSLACFMPSAEIIRYDGEPHPVSLGEAQAVADAIIKAGFTLAVEYELYTLELPNGAVRGFHLRIGDPFDLIIFENESIARDTALCYPHALQSGRFLLASSPDKMFKDDLNVHPLADEEIAWSRLLALDHFVEAFLSGTTIQEAPAILTIADLVRATQGTDYEITPHAVCPRDAIPAAAVVGISASLGGDPFIIYRFAGRDKAASYSRQQGHVLAFGVIAFRSDPDVYVIPKPLSTIRKPDEAIAWSGLLANEGFIKAIRAITQ